MSRVSRHDLLRIWEGGHLLSHPDLAVLLLLAASPQRSEDEVLDLPVGVRDCELMRVYRDNISADLVLVERCHHCKEALEFALTIDDLLRQSAESNDAQHFAVELSTGRASLRLPTSRDLLAVLNKPDPDQALLQRCLDTNIVADPGAAVGDEVGDEVSEGAAPSLSTENIASISRCIEAADPMAHVNIDLRCHQCGQHNESVFDIVSLLWKAWSEQVQHWLEEVFQLALHFGWSEESILAMSDSRRRFYLARLGL